jgi:hypothetical protein
MEHWTGTTLQSLAYRQLQVSAAKDGNATESALFGYLAAKFDPIKGEHPEMPMESAFGMKTAQRNAAVVEVSGLMVILFGGLVLAAIAILIIAKRPGARPVATMVFLTSAAGLLFSSVTLYLTYRPYWYIFQSAIQSGDRVPTTDLSFFLQDLSMLLGVSPQGYTVLLNALLYSGSPSFLFYVWAGVTLLGISGLVLILLRHFLGRPRAHAP